MRILVAGKTGQLAFSLVDLADAYGADITCMEPPELDLTNSEQTYQVVLNHKPDILINAAAYTAVDAAEENCDLAFAINRDGTEALARAAAALDIPFLHVSTDYVYSGDLDRPYIEADETGPTGVYGVSKLEGEQAALEIHEKTAVFRTAWVYSPYGKNFVKTMLWLAENKTEVGIVADQYGNPTYALEIARSLLEVSKRISRQGWQETFRGVFHLCGKGDASWHGFATEIFRQANRLLSTPVPSTINALTTDQYPTPAKRPTNSRLDCSKLKATFDLELPEWQASLEECIRKLKEQEK